MVRSDATGNMQRRKDLKIAVVCSSNQNRSMEAHSAMRKRGFQVQSFGTGTYVKLPGPAPDKPNVYTFGTTTYDEMYKELYKKDAYLYTQNGILHMLDRNRRIKKRPERYQDCPDEFDIVVTCEERVYDQVIEDMSKREQHSFTPVHIINIEIADNHEEATIGAGQIVELCEILEELDDMEHNLDEILQAFEEKIGRHILHTVAFY
ncbi:RNA polymerase II subunit A C-terminal domain phosphatase SSU72-like [Rhopilema esculentum]|uniref:RNA polymerase II subunit A C-terminal domain phosphatase SSU72-like n=1 Tax=Rhopilema esculentum TaxID=499914 RepID=UPI0031D08AA3